MSNEALSEEFYERARALLEERLWPKRYQHSLSVAETAVQLAQAYGLDVRRARIAGLLHDWDKGYSDKEIRARAREFGIDVSPEVIEHMPALLHGPTAACDLARRFPELDADILQAISRHTSAALEMSDLDMVVYTADAIEPLRSFSSMEKLRAAVGTISLEDLFLETFRNVTMLLVQKRKIMHPDTVKVWNYYIERMRQRKPFDDKGRFSAEQKGSV